MLLNELLDDELLLRMRGEGYVGAQLHPSLPLAILNYTQRCQFDRVWNDVTRQCRGLIYDYESLEVVARPWPKFHNYAEHEEGTLDLSARAVVADKLDGSLGILYPGHGLTEEFGGYGIATRGSFASEQAIHATELFKRRYENHWLPEPGFTYLFEIVYPGNRIVVDYGDLDDLILLGVVHTETGTTVYQLDGDGDPVGLPSGWPGPVAQQFAYRTLAEALAAEPRENCEGLVVHLLDEDTHVKIKQDDYVALHRIVTGLNERTVWEHLERGEPLDELLAPLPEEFHDWVRDVAARLEEAALEIELGARYEYAALDRMGLDRKSFAALANESEYRPYLFMFLDGRDVRPAIWKTLRPTFPRTLVDVAAES